MATQANREQNKIERRSRRRTAWQVAGLYRHEGPRVRPVDIQIRRAVSRTTEWRVRHLPGFPEPDAFGTYDARAVDEFWDSLTPTDLAAMRQRKSAKRDGEGAS